MVVSCLPPIKLELEWEMVKPWLFWLFCVPNGILVQVCLCLEMSHNASFFFFFFFFFFFYAMMGLLCEHSASIFHHTFEGQTKGNH